MVILGFAAAGALLEAGVLTVKETALARIIGNGDSPFYRELPDHAARIWGEVRSL